MHLRPLIIFIIITQSHQDCLYTVELKQELYLSGFDVIFNCSYGTEDAQYVNWETKATESDEFRDVYSALPTFPAGSSPAPEFVGKVEGEFGDETSAHLLTVYNASDSDDLNIWSCVVRTPACTGGVKDEITMVLADPAFDRVALAVNGEETCGEVRFPDPVTVTCSAISDPVSTVSLNIEGSTAQSCSRVAGDAPQPWNCSVSAPVTKSTSMYCTAVYTLTGETRTTSTVSILIGPEPWTD